MTSRSRIAFAFPIPATPVHAPAPAAKVPPSIALLGLGAATLPDPNRTPSPTTSTGNALGLPAGLHYRDRLSLEMLLDPLSSTGPDIGEIPARSGWDGQVVLPAALKKLKMAA